MKRLLPLFVLMVFGTSCASLLNTRNKRLYISSDQPVYVTTAGKGTTELRTEHRIKVPRSGEPRVLFVAREGDSIAQKITLRPRNSFLFFTNVVWNYGLGMIVDVRSPKRYNYRSNIALDWEGNDFRIRRFSNTPAGTWNLGFSIPYGNFFYIGPQTSAGFWGLSTKLDYYHRPDRSVSLRLGYSIDHPFGIPVAADVFGVYSRASCGFVAAQYNLDYRSFQVGAGLSVLSNALTFLNRPLEPYSIRYYRDIGMGGSFSAYYKMGHFFRWGCLYLPKIYSPHYNRIWYEHQISLDLLWNFRIKKGKKHFD